MFGYDEVGIVKLAGGYRSEASGNCAARTEGARGCPRTKQLGSGGARSRARGLLRCGATGRCAAGRRAAGRRAAGGARAARACLVGRRVAEDVGERDARGEDAGGIVAAAGHDAEAVHLVGR